MKKITFIRHAESEANAGKVTFNDAEIVLSRKGQMQAKELALNIIDKPDIIICSSYYRTQQTAKPLVEKFMGVPVLIIPIHEFTYLSPAVAAGTTAMQRRNWVFDYWAYNDPDFVHGSGAESFNQFAKRIQECLQFLIGSPNQKIVVFTHGHVLRMIWQQLLSREFTNGAEKMHHFYLNMGLLPVPNICVFNTKVEDNEMKIIEPQFNPDYLRLISGCQP